MTLKVVFKMNVLYVWLFWELWKIMSIIIDLMWLILLIISFVAYLMKMLSLLVKLLFILQDLLSFQHSINRNHLIKFVSLWGFARIRTAKFLKKKLKNMKLTFKIYLNYQHLLLGNGWFIFLLIILEMVICQLLTLIMIPIRMCLLLEGITGEVLTAIKWRKTFILEEKVDQSC